MNITKCDAEIYLGHTVIGQTEGNWRVKSFKISLQGNLAATVSCKTSAASILVGADSYCIEISEGIDSAFILGVIIALDEIYHDGN